MPPVTGTASQNEKLMRIMIVDDARVMRKSVTKILKGLNDVVEAEDGEKAWQRLQKDKAIKIVCCDLSMPVLDGYGFLQKVRQSDDERIRNMPVIIVTGQEDTGDNRNRIFEAGATGFLSKPFDSAQLRASIQTHAKLVSTTNELADKNTQLQESAAIDELTGLGTKAFFEKSAMQALSYARRSHQDLVAVRVSIDNFRELFFNIGKLKSHKVIKKIAEILSRHTRQEDMLCRVGLEEFAALLSTRDFAGAVRTMNRVQETIGTLSLQHQGKTISVSVSTGLAKVIVDDATRTMDLMDAADKYLQAAKKKGGNHVCYDESAVRHSNAPTLNVEQALYLLKKDRHGQVEEQLDGLLDRMRPLLKMYVKHSRENAARLIRELQALMK